MVPKNLRPLIPYLKRHRSGLFWGAVCVLFNNGIWVLFPQVLRRAINDLHSGVTREKLLTYSAAILGIALVKGIFQFLTRWVVIGISRDIEFDLRNDLFAHLERLSYSYYQRNRTGDIMARATNDLNAVRMLLGPAIMYSANTIVFTAGALAFMLAISPKLTLYAFLPLPIASIVIQYFGRRIHERFERIQAMFSDISGPRAGKLFRRARHPRLRAGRSRDCRLRGRQSGIHPPQPRPGAAHGNALAHAGTHARRRRGDRALARRTRSPPRKNLRRRFRRLQHLHGAADLAGDRPGLGHQHLPARHRVDGAHRRNPLPAARDRRRGTDRAIGSSGHRAI